MFKSQTAGFVKNSSLKVQQYRSVSDGFVCQTTSTQLFAFKSNLISTRTFLVSRTPFPVFRRSFPQQIYSQRTYSTETENDLDEGLTEKQSLNPEWRKFRHNITFAVRNLQRLQKQTSTVPPFEEVEKIFNEAVSSGIPEDNFSLGLVMKAAGRLNNEAKVKEYWNRLVKAGPLTTSIYDVLLDTYNSMNRPESVEQIYQQIKKAGLKPDSHTITARLRAARGDDEKVRKIMQDLEANQVPMDAHLYSALIGHANSIGNVEETERLLEQMNSNGIRHNSATVSELLEGYTKTRNFQAGTRLFEEVRKDENLKLSPRVYEKALLCAAKSGNIGKVDDTYALMISNKIRLGTPIFNALIEGYQKGSDFHRAWMTYEKVMRNKVPGTQANAGTFVAIINACGFHSQPEKLQQVLDRLKGTIKLNPTIWHSIVQSHMKLRELPKAVQAIFDMRDQGFLWQQRHRNAIVMNLKRGDYPDNMQNLVDALVAAKEDREMGSEITSQFEQLLKVLRI